MTALSAFYSTIAPHVIDSTYLPLSIFSPVTADLNGDGNQDLIVLGASYPSSSNTSPVPQPGRVFFGDGHGNFSEASPSVFPMGSLLTVHPRKVLTGDFNHDGRLDVFISCHGWDTNPFPGEQNRLYLSQPDGSWLDATSTLPQLSDYSHTSAVGDINGDGSLDVFVGNGYGGQNNILSYMLMNSGTGQFTSLRTNIPTASGSVLDFSSGHQFPGATLADLNGDGYPDLIINADASASFNKNTQTAILWNQWGSFSQSTITLLPATTRLASHIDLDTEAIDINGDGKLDLVTCGTQGNPFYDGWFVQVLLNRGGNVFEDVTSSVMATTDSSSGNFGVAAGSPWAMWVKVLDFNNDGFPDFAVEYNGQSLTQSTPLVWLNDGTGHFTTLKVSDFVASGDEWKLGGGHLVQTANGYSFITTQSYSGSGGLVLTGLLATQAYVNTPAASGPLVGTTGNDVLRGTGNGDTLDGGAGTDTAIYVGPRSLYTVSHSGTNWTVSGSAGTETLVNIERVRFSDKSVALDLKPTDPGGEAALMISAALGKSLGLSDAGDLKDIISFFDAGFTMGQGCTILANVGVLDRVSDKFGGGHDSKHFVDWLYQNVFNKAPDSATEATLIAQLNSVGEATYFQTVTTGADNQANVNLVGLVSGVAFST